MAIFGMRRVAMILGNHKFENGPSPIGRQQFTGLDADHIAIYGRADNGGVSLPRRHRGPRGRELNFGDLEKIGNV